MQACYSHCCLHTAYLKLLHRLQAPQLSEHGLQLVTTSATCDDSLFTPFGSVSDEAAEGDGMAMPLSAVRRNAEQLESLFNGSMQSAWNPSDNSHMQVWSSYTDVCGQLHCSVPAVY